MISKVKQKFNLMGNFINENLTSIKTIKSGEIKLKMVVNTSYEDMRLNTLFTKEPETITWIKTLFKKGDIFYDIGANIGVYSLFTAAYHQKKVKTISIEPAYHNFSKLCSNININKLEDCIIPYCIGLGSKTSFTTLYISSNISGSSGHNMDQPINQFGNQFKPQFKQGIFSITFDELIRKYKLPFPNHIKIDVDGFEVNILKGAKSILSDRRVKSLLIEVTDIDFSKINILHFMQRFGFNSNHPINFQSNHSRENRQKLGVGQIENIIFTKKDHK